MAVSIASHLDLHLRADERVDHKRHLLAPGDELTLIRGGRILNPGGRVVPASLLLKGDQILALDHEPISTPSSARVIDAHGLTLLPGLIDAHVHLAGTTSLNPTRRYMLSRPSDTLIVAAFNYYQLLASGFTTVRALGHGLADHAYALRSANQRGLIRGPRLLTSGWALSPTRGHGHIPELPYDWVARNYPRSAFCDGVDECRALVRRNVREGADVIKVYASEGRSGRRNFSPEELRAIVEEAGRLGKPVAAHAETTEGVLNALGAGVSTIEHGPLDASTEVLERLRDSGAALVPTLAYQEQIVREGLSWGLSEVSIDAARRKLESRMDVVRAADRLGVPIVVGSDCGARAGYGKLAARELWLLDQCGISATSALAAATSTAAKALGLERWIGRLEPGKLSEVVGYEGNPVNDLRILDDRSRLRIIIQSSRPLA